MTHIVIRDVPDDVVVALNANAQRAGLTVLHDDKDFDLIAAITDQPVERLEV